ncbi:MAG: hypothetical protein HUU35_02700 [Armatimonadetes bacterium]|nr:hypothetical protein [Armatimonadota bacterium]
MFEACQCFFCRHLHDGYPLQATCDAFPNGIPHQILRNRWDHRQRVPGDCGIGFELAAGASGEDVTLLLDFYAELARNSFEMDESG